MQLDLIGRIENTNLSVSKPLLPLYEAIINSIQAIEDRGIQEGIITIEVERTSDLPEERGTNVHAIKSFKITDNGIGFNENNYLAFNTADTTNKKARGSKGIGRFIWLKAFTKVLIESYYSEDDQYKKRTFNFTLTKKGIENEELIIINEKKYLTQIILFGLKENFHQFCPRNIESISEKIIEHCLVYFVTGTTPIIQLHDSANDKTIVLNDAFRDLQRQLEGTENRINTERNRFNEVVQPYNVKVRRFPTNIFAGMFGFNVRPPFEAAAGSQNAPPVNFGNGNTNTTPAITDSTRK